MIHAAYSQTAQEKDYRVELKMADWVNNVLTSSHDDIKIPTKLQKNHHCEPPGVWLNRSPMSKAIQKKPH